MRYSRTEEMLLDTLNARMAGAAFFECAGCKMMHPKEDYGHSSIYRARDKKIGELTSKAAVYVVCKKCEALPEPDLDRRILETLAKDKYFG